MAETYTVQANLTVHDELSAALAESAKRAAALSEALKRATAGSTEAFRKLGTAGAQAFTRIGDVAAKLDRALGGLGDEAVTTAAKFKDAGTAMAAGFDAPIRAVAKLQAAVDRLGRTPIRAGSGGAGGAGGGGTGGTGGTPRPHGGGDPWVNSIVLGALGLGMVDAVRKPITSGAGLQDAQLALQMQLGSSPTASRDYQMASKAALAEALAQPSTTPTQNLGTLGDLYSVVGTMKEAVAMLGPITQLKLVSQKARPGSDFNAYNAVKAGENLGLVTNPINGQIDPARLAKFFGVLEAAEIATHGNVNENTFLGFSKQAGIAAKGLTTQGLMDLIPMMNEFGGPRAGTALAAMYANVVGGIMPQRVANLWESLKGPDGKPLLDSKNVHPTKTGYRIDPGAMQGTQLFQQDPFAWIQTYLAGPLQKAGDSNGQIQTVISQMFSRQTGQRGAGMLAGQIMQILKDRIQMQQSMSAAQAAATQNSQGFTQNLVNLQGSWNSLMQELGLRILPPLIPLMQQVTAGLGDLTKAVVAHPNAARDLGLIGGGLGVLATGLSAVFAVKGVAGLLALGGKGFGGSVAGDFAGAFGRRAGLGLIGAVLPEAGPIGLAIGAAFLASLGLSKLDGWISGSAAPNVGKPRDGYHPAGGSTAGPTGSAGGFIGWLQKEWQQAQSGPAGKTIDGKPLTLPSAASSTTSPATTTPDASTLARIDRQGNRELATEIGAAVATALSGVTIKADGRQIAVLVTARQVSARRAVMQRGTAGRNRTAPSMPSQAVHNR